jgi:hypothetical protein
MDPYSMIATSVAGAAAGGPSNASGSSDGNIFDYNGNLNIGSGSITDAGTGRSIANTTGQVIESLIPVALVGAAIFLGVLWLKRK